MGSDPWLKAITSTVGHLAVSFLCRRAKRPPSRPDGRSIGAMRPDQAVKIGAQQDRRYSPLALGMLPSSNSTGLTYRCRSVVIFSSAANPAVGSHLLNSLGRRSNNCPA
jgi:hypothetical protein